MSTKPYDNLERREMARMDAEIMNNPKLKIRVIHPEKTDWMHGCNFITVGYTFNYASDCLKHLYNVCRDHKNAMGWK